LGLDQDEYVVGNVGRLHPDKDQKTLIQGFAKALPEMGKARLVIVGEGRLKQELKSLACELGVDDRVSFLGRIQDAWKYFKAFDVFALTSDYEPFGMVLLEAMVAGVPVISTNVGGASEVVGDLGDLFPVGGEQKLSSCIKAVKCRKNSHNSLPLKRVEDFFSDKSSKSYFFCFLKELV
jgi:glycosyltransferase involved in cell wall biosynthesis